MAQIHALTPDGRLPTAAVEHVGELTEDLAEQAALDTLASNAYKRLGDVGSAHLDTVQTLGLYSKASTGNATPANGYPVQSRGNLWVMPISASAIIQVYFASWVSQVHIREYYSGTWSPWIEVSNAGVLATVQALTDRVDALEAGGGSGGTTARTATTTGDYRPDAFVAPDGVVSYWTGPSGVERIPWTYKGEGYVGRVGGAAGYTTMQVKKTNSVEQLEVSCLNPSTGRHITHAINGPSGSSDDQRRFINAFVGPYTGTTVSSDLEILPRSNIEWAFQIDVDGNAQFAPYHGSTSCKAMQYEPPVFTDAHGEVIDVPGMARNTPVSVEGFKIRQRLYIIHPDSGETKWAAVDEVRTIAPDGMIQSEAVATFLEDTKLASNYGTMTPVATGTFDQMHILDGSTYSVPTTAPAVTEYITITEGHEGTSALFTSTSKPNAFVAMALLDPDSTLRRGDPQEETSASALNLELRSNGYVKLYPQSYAPGSVIPKGTVWRIGAQWRYGETQDPGQYA